MTPVLVLGHAVLAVLWLLFGALGTETRDRLGRVLSGIGLLLGLGLVVFRGSLDGWRAIDLDPTSAAVVGAAAACGWGLTLALDLGVARWWTGALTGVAATGLISFAGSVWLAPALLFLGAGAAPIYLALARSSRTLWVAVALADAGLVAALVSDAVIRDEWSVPTTVSGYLLIPVACAVILRLGLVPRLGSALRSPAGALVPITAGGAFIVLVRWVERPEPVAGAIMLLLAIGSVAWSVGRRALDPALVALWPVASSAGILMVSPRASASAGVAGILGLSAVLLWPDALERGRLTRGFLLSGVIPNVAFGALATAAAGAFARAKMDGPVHEMVAWNAVSGLLPIVCAAGVALGASVARAEARGGYHPEAVFMSWGLLIASVIAGVVLGTGEVYGVIGGMPAIILFAVASLAGVVAVSRFGPSEVEDPVHLATVTLNRPLELPGWSVAIAAIAHVAAAGAVAWLTVSGLQTGFL